MYLIFFDANLMCDCTGDGDWSAGLVELALGEFGASSADPAAGAGGV
jgi:hypothetical protein